MLLIGISREVSVFPGAGMSPLSVEERDPPGLSGRVLLGLLAFAATRARPDEAVAVTVLVVKEVSEDRGVEARVIELEAEIVATLVGALGPCGADFGSTDENPVAGSVCRQRRGFRGRCGRCVPGR